MTILDAKPRSQQTVDNNAQRDLEKVEINISTSSSVENTDTSRNSPTRAEHDISPTPVLFRGRFARFNERIERLSGLEARGITRVLPEEKYHGGAQIYPQMALFWFSINTAVNNLAVGLLGPLVFNLGYVDSVLLTVFGCALGACGSAYTSTWGAESGNRTMVRSSHRRLEPVFEASGIGSNLC